jgi:hypothetical protein
MTNTTPNTAVEPRAIDKITLGENHINFINEQVRKLEEAEKAKMASHPAFLSHEELAAKPVSNANVDVRHDRDSPTFHDKESNTGVSNTEVANTLAVSNTANVVTSNVVVNTFIANT